MNMLRSVLRFARTHRAAAWALAFAFYLATPFAPAPWETNLAAQTALTATSLSAAVTDTSGTVVTVASATGITAPGTNGTSQVWLYVDGELMSVRAISSTVVTVGRGQNGTRATTHPSGALVYVVVSPFALTTVDYSGSCTASNQTYLPVINVRNGNVWNCINSLWQGANLTAMMEIKPRVSVAGTAYTILPTDYMVVLSTISNAVAAKSFTLPSHVGLAGKQIVIKDESGGISATTTIILVGTIDGTNSGTATVVQLKTPFGAVMLEAGSGGWFVISCLGGNGSQVCR